MITCEYSSQTKNPAENIRVGDFVSNEVWGIAGQFGPHASMGVYDDGELIAGTVYHNWHPQSGVMELSSASRSKRWLQPHVIRAMFSFPFDLMPAQMVVLRVSERNKVMVSIAKRFGFDGVLVPRLRGRDEAEWVFTLTDDQWLASRYRK